MKQTIRIIGGQYRGKKLHFPAVDGLRPTPDRVRETLFNWLMHDIQNASCLDAFAGSGALGIEALSRGAAKVTLLERNPIAYTQLVKIAASFRTPKLEIKQIDAHFFLEQTNVSYDIIFLDPPFANNDLPRCMEALAHTNILHKSGLVYIESSEPISINKTLWQELKLKKAGQVIYGLYKKKE